MGRHGGLVVGAVAMLAHATGVGVAAQELPLARTDQGRWAEVIATSRGKLDSLRRAMSVPGLSISVSVDRRVVWSEGMGYADLELRSPATPQTRYRIGSVSKIQTAAGTAFLHQRGDLDLDAPVQDWAGGGLLSTTEDLLRFAHAHLEPGLFSRETLDLV